MNKVPRWVFCYIGNKTFDFSSKKKGFFAQKRPNLAMQAYSVPCWWVGWWLWRAGCISQDTYLLYLFSIHKLLIHYLFLLFYTLLAPIIRGDRCPIQLTLVIWICQVFHDK